MSFNNSRKQFLFLPLAHLLTETETWLCQEDIPWAAIYHNNAYSHTSWYKIQFTFWNGDVISVWHITCTAIHHHPYTSKLLFVWYHFILFKSSGQISWQTNTQTQVVKTSFPIQGWYIKWIRTNMVKFETIPPKYFKYASGSSFYF